MKLLVKLYSMVTPWAKANAFQIRKNRGLGLLANFLYPIWCRCNAITDKDSKISDDNDIIVSLTSYPGRIGKVALCIESLLRQDKPARKVILWLANEQFPEHKLPSNLERIKSDNFEVRYCDDLRSYKKIFYVAQEYTNSIIITADDDTLYPEDWVSELYNTSLLYPETIVCYRAHKIVLNEDLPIEYNKWNHLSPDIKGPDGLLVAIGVGGILYPAGFFRDITLDYQIINRICPSTDDLWLKAIEMKKKYKVVKVNTDSKEWFTIRGTQKTGLMKCNVNENINDEAFKNLIEYYELSFGE